MPTASEQYVNDAASGVDPFEDDLFPSLEIPIEEILRRTEELKEFVRKAMVEDEDYGIIPGTNKPTLFKPGAEKLCLAYGLSKEVSRVEAKEDWDAGLIAYTVKVTLKSKRTGAIEAEGVGQCNSQERRYKNQDASNVANTLLKMAEKRALVDATIAATRASAIFTQDMEDLRANGAVPDDVQARAEAPTRTAAPVDNGYQPEYPQGTAPATPTGPIRGSSAYIMAVQAVEKGQEAKCFRCGGSMWDNRVNKKNPNGPDFKCKDVNCKDDKGYVTSYFPPRNR